MTKLEDTLKRFKNKHPQLMRLNPKVVIDEIKEMYDSSIEGEMIIFDPPVPEITVQHPFIFDNRLVPESFENLRVRNMTMGSFPREFPSGNAALPLEEWYSPKNYETFVINNLDLIRRTLKSPNMSKSEALDALTGDFKEHKKWCRDLREKHIAESRNEISFLKRLLSQTEKAFLQSDVKQRQENKGWGFRVTAMIRNNKPLIVDFNWKTNNKLLGESNKYKAQEKYYLRIFESNYEELGPLKGVPFYFHEYFPQALTGMHTSYCFFRSENENQISLHDLKLSSHLFDQYLEYSSPSIVISFSKKLKEYLEKSGRLKIIKKKEIKSNNHTAFSSIGKLYYKSGETVDFICLPHPNCPISKQARASAWQFCFENYNN